ncbi:MAG: hypothetical protein GVY36_16795 [Verrucomicrobia bacterium]|jgi:hypothetical protein|nr:hypothetical protein [Verrucomicrobiota bacterium]
MFLKGNPADVAQHDKMVTLVERMLDLQQQKAGEGNPNTLKQLETRIKATDPCFALRATQDAAARSTASFTHSTN